MAGIKALVPRDEMVGVFRGFSDGGLEFHADLALPYRSDYHQRPLHGFFLLIELDGEREAILGRITSLRSEGRLASPDGEDYLYRQARNGQSPPEDIREQFLKYRVSVRVLGVMRQAPDGSLTFVASHRRIPHVGSPVVFPSGEILREIANHH
ncbi:MAG: ATPase, partial [Bacillota bacterium]|nr:ATPase [Bacillota bacterium]